LRAATAFVGDSGEERLFVGVGDLECAPSMTTCPSDGFHQFHDIR